MGFADNMYKTAVKLIDKYGSDVIVKTGKITSYDPTTGENVVTTTDVPTKAFIESVSSSQVVEGEITLEDYSILVPSMNLFKGDHVVHKGKTLRVLAIVDRVESQNKEIIFTAIGRTV